MSKRAKKPKLPKLKPPDLAWALFDRETGERTSRVFERRNADRPLMFLSDRIARVLVTEVVKPKRKAKR